jgi:rRNA-processing protein FCF1
MVKNVFLDSMIFLHYRKLDQLDLCSLLDADEVNVLVPRITLRELDSHKDTHKSRKIRERARKILHDLEKWFESGGYARAGISVNYHAGRSDFDYVGHGLDKGRNDDELIAAVLQFQDDGNNQEALLVTEDYALRISARHLGIRVVSIPEEYKLPIELDAVELENQELKRKLAKFESALPKLEVGFYGSTQNNQFSEFSLRVSLDDAYFDVEAELKAKQEKYPKLELDLLESSGMRSDLTMLTIYGPMKGVLAAKHSKYNDELDEYFEKYEKFLRNTNKLKEISLRTITFRLEIKNSGFSPADDVDMEFYFPEGVLLCQKEKIPEYPKEPSPPEKPRSSRQSMFEIPAFGVLHETILPANYIRRGGGSESSLRIKRSNGYEISDNVGRIKHGDRYVTPELCVIFESFESARSFKCDYVVRPVNLPEPVCGMLNFKISRPSRAQ